MKPRRFFSSFFAALLCALILTVPARATETDKAAEGRAIQAKAVLLVERTSGQILYSRNADEQLYPSSLVKIMTALLVLEAVEEGKLTWEQKLTASPTALAATIGLTAGLDEGEEMSVRDLLACVLVVSANDASHVLAEAVAGSIDAFVSRMNDRARELGCTNTNFFYGTGDHRDDMYTSAADLYLITEEALKHKDFLPICDSADLIIAPTNTTHKERHYRTTNYLLSNYRALGYIYRDAHGIKDSSSTQAGHCLVTSAAKDDLEMLCIILGAQKVTLEDGKTQVQSFSEATRLMKWGFANFAYQTILTPNDMLASMPVTMSASDAVTLHSAKEITVLMPVVLSPSDLVRTIRFPSKSVEAPVTVGQQLAEVELSYGDEVYAVVPLVALNSVAASETQIIERDVQSFFTRTEVKIAMIAAVVLVVLVVLWKLTIGKRRYRYGRSVRGRSNYRGRRK